MCTLHQASRALQAGLGLALVAALALLNGCASGGVDDASRQPSDPSSGEAADATVGPAPPGIYTCILENGQPGSLVVFSGPFGSNPCAITATELAGSSKAYCNEGVCHPCKYLQHKWECPSV